MDKKTLELINTLSDLVLMTLVLLQQITKKTDAEVENAMETARVKTKDLLKQLR